MASVRGNRTSRRGRRIYSRERADNLRRWELWLDQEAPAELDAAVHAILAAHHPLLELLLKSKESTP